MRNCFYFEAISLFMCSAIGCGVAADRGESTHLPAELAPWFEPPAEFANQFGPYRSPLFFKDGDPVRTAADWPRRREEIRRRWHEIMGPWPRLLEQPRLVILERTPREN